MAPAWTNAGEPCIILIVFDGAKIRLICQYILVLFFLGDFLFLVVFLLFLQTIIDCFFSFIFDVMTSNYFITNTKENNLAKVIRAILPSKTKSLDILVGYFYFSGIKEIYSTIADKPIRILVGLELEQELLKETAEFDFYAKKLSARKTSIEAVRSDFNKSLVTLFNKSKFFEDGDQIEAFKAYYEKIKDGSLEIRKTADPSHAKMYIFTYNDELTEEGMTPGTVITGSSNLTYSGLRNNNEINVRFHAKPEYDQAKEIFETLWEDATVLVDKDHIQDFEDGVIKHIWYEKLPSPYLLYLRVLYEYFAIDETKRIHTPNEITKGGYNDFMYQIDAIRLGIDSIEKHNGVIIADVVGLGKSIIGAAIANNLDLRTIIIAPPHLKSQWEGYSREFGLRYTSVFSNGKIDAAVEFYTSQILNSRDKDPWLIILDEAHNYRNDETKDYAMLHELCQGNKVMLLTATPFNNAPNDIYSLLKLFQIPTKSTLSTVNNLGEEFRDLIAKYRDLKKRMRGSENANVKDYKAEIQNIAKRIRMIIEPVVIRRSRIDLKKIETYAEDLKKQGYEFPIVKDPQLMEYDLGDLTKLYIETLRAISPKDSEKELSEDEIASNDAFGDKFGDLETVDPHDENEKNDGFRAARYKPILYIKEGKENGKTYLEIVKKLVEDAGFDYQLLVGTQTNLAKFMRTLLVRRFESSQYAFKKSIESMLKNCTNIQNWIKKRESIPVFKKGSLPDIQALYNSNNDDSTELSNKSADDVIATLEFRGLFEIPVKYLKKEFFDDLQHDIDLLKKVQDDWEKVSFDPKLKVFVSILSEKLEKDPQRKIVVFSQFADTVDYLYKELLVAKLPVFSYTSGTATIKNKKIIEANFDAGFKGKQANDYKILLATDAISEGYNLHRAGMVINYDIPYNPTRVIQRVGRINRINLKVFNELFIYNYFPTAIGESDASIKEISTFKMAMIHAIMGEDTKILTSEENPHSYFVEQYKKIISNEEQQSWDTPYRNMLNNLLGQPVMEEALNVPLRCKIRRLTSKPREGVLVFARKGHDLIFKFKGKNLIPEDLVPEEALRLIEAESNEMAHEVSNSFVPVFNDLRDSLFMVDDTGDTNNRTKREALEKIKVMIQANSCNLDYLHDLKTVIENDAISTYALRQIKKLKQNQYNQLPTIVREEYVQSILKTLDNISHGEETLIFAEEIESNNIKK